MKHWQDPYNAFILNDSSCCEVSVLGEEADVDHTEYHSKECTCGAFHDINWDNVHIVNCIIRHWIE